MATVDKKSAAEKKTTEEKKPVTILGGKYELKGVEKHSTLILQGQEVRWDYLTDKQAAALVLENIPYIKLLKQGKVSNSEEKPAEEVEEPFPDSTNN